MSNRHEANFKLVSAMKINCPGCEVNITKDKQGCVISVTPVNGYMDVTEDATDHVKIEVTKVKE